MHETVSLVDGSHGCEDVCGEATVWETERAKGSSWGLDGVTILHGGWIWYIGFVRQTNITELTLLVVIHSKIDTKSSIMFCKFISKIKRKRYKAGRRPCWSTSPRNRYGYCYRELESPSDQSLCLIQYCSCDGEALFRGQQLRSCRGYCQRMNLTFIQTRHSDFSVFYPPSMSASRMGTRRNEQELQARTSRSCSHP